MTAASRGNFWSVPAEATGAWAAKRELAAALRDLVALCVETGAPEDELHAAAAATRALTAQLAPHPRRRFQDAYGDARQAADLHQFADRGTLVGLCNPIAPPMRLHHEAGVSVGEVSFGPPFEGAPGWVHGGIVAAAFDQVFGHLQVNLQVPSLTGSLTVRYLRGTPLATPLRFEGRVDRVDGKKSHVTARCHAGEHITAEAQAVFIEVEPERMRKLFEREK